MLKEYLEPYAYERIPEEKVPRADLKLEFGEYKFLIEQKSSLLGIRAKQQNTNIDTTKTFCRNTIIKAIKQLHTTESDLHNGKYIKIILLYEDYLPPLILNSIFSMDECPIEDDNLYWLVNINEMEMFLHTIKNHPELLHDIIVAMSTSNYCRDLTFCLSYVGVIDNLHLKQAKFENYESLIYTAIKTPIHE